MKTSDVDELGGKWHYLWEGTASENILDFEETQKSMENILFLVDVSLSLLLLPS